MKLDKNTNSKPSKNSNCNFDKQQTYSDKISYSKPNRTPNFYFDMFVNRDLIKLPTANKKL